MTIEENVPLAPLTTFKLGGAARFFARVSTVSELQEALAFAQANHARAFVLGGGSNMLVRDEGFAGLVIHILLSGVEQTETGYIAAAGENWDALCAQAVADGRWGIENLSGIPGTLGGACVQNIGAYGAALSEVVSWVEALDTHTGALVRLSRAECAFGYRTSIFKQQEGRYVVLRAALELSRDPRPNLAYKDLSTLFDGRTPTLADIRTDVLAIRAAKFPSLEEEGTAGSFFLNPVVSEPEAKALGSRYLGMPLFAMPETSNIKVPLGWLLDRVLNLKGAHVGGARLFERQALVIAASRTATASEVLALRDLVKKEVKEKIGIDICEEVKIL
jgi:UDP-N-acetylmuramate dehydrogenase